MIENLILRAPKHKIVEIVAEYDAIWEYFFIKKANAKTYQFVLNKELEL
jgi:hypothetical protein